MQSNSHLLLDCFSAAPGRGSSSSYCGVHGGQLHRYVGVLACYEASTLRGQQCKLHTKLAATLSPPLSPPPRFRKNTRRKRGVTAVVKLNIRLRSRAATARKLDRIPIPGGRCEASLLKPSPLKCPSPTAQVPSTDTCHNSEEVGGQKSCLSFVVAASPRGKISPDFRGAWHEAKHPAFLFAPTYTARDQYVERDGWSSPGQNPHTASKHNSTPVCCRLIPKKCGNPCMRTLGLTFKHPRIISGTKAVDLGCVHRAKACCFLS